MYFYVIKSFHLIACIIIEYMTYIEAHAKTEMCISY